MLLFSPNILLVYMLLNSNIRFKPLLARKIILHFLSMENERKRKKNKEYQNFIYTSMGIFKCSNEKQTNIWLKYKQDMPIPIHTHDTLDIYSTIQRLVCIAGISHIHMHSHSTCIAMHECIKRDIQHRTNVQSEVFFSIFFLFCFWCCRYLTTIIIWIFEHVHRNVSLIQN